VRKAGENPVEYIKITMKEILISAVSTGGSGGEDKLTENVTLNFADFKFEYTPQKDDGSADSAIEALWNIPANAEKA
jgi:type VI secretion system secreted protein Hcp